MNTFFKSITTLFALCLYGFSATINIPSDYTTIQAGLNAADSADTVLVQPDTYYENIFWPETNGIKLISAGDTSNTIIDGGGNGGVIYMNPQSVTIDTTTIITGFKIYNGNADNGGGLYINNSSPKLVDITIKNNNAKNGGGVYIGGSLSSPIIINTSLNNNISNENGGGIYCDSSTISMTNIIIKNNAVINTNTPIDTKGGGIYINGGSLLMVDVIVNSNSAEYGGGIYIDKSNITIKKVFLLYNLAKCMGGSIALYSSNTTMDEVTIEGNSANYFHGGGIYGENSTLSMKNVVIKNNSTLKYGGGIYINGGSLLMVDVIVNSNTAENGGGIFSGGCSLSMTDIIFESNSTRYEGGGLYSIGGLLSITNVIVKNNSTFQYGGGLKFKMSSGTMDKVSIEYNSSGYDGGGIYSEYSNISMTNIIIKNNSANKFGGGMYMRDCYSPPITDITIRDNKANEGGGMYLEKSSPIINNLILSNNLASSGGGIYLFNISAPTINHVKISNNYANEVGGGMYIFESSPIIDNLVLSNNLARKGGGMYLKASNPIMNHNTLSENSAQICSGIYIESGELDISQSNITYHGTALYNASNAVIINAANNYWGHSSGPYHPTQNTSGKGDSTNYFVNVSPWLTSPNIDAPPIPPHDFKVIDKGNDFITLSWGASPLPDLDFYRVYYDTDTTGLYEYSDSIDVASTDTSLIITGLPLGQTFYFSAVVVDIDGNKSWYSKEISATTRVLEAKNLILQDENDVMHVINHTPTVSFDYFDSMGETQTAYHIQVSSNSDYSSIDLWDSDIVQSSTESIIYSGNELLDGETYYLRIRVSANTDWGDWSTLVFRMNSKPNTPEPVYPVNNHIVNSPVILKTLNATDAEGDDLTYTFKVYADTDLSVMLDSVMGLVENTDTTSWQINTVLPDNGQYYWTVSANDGFEESVISDAESFLLNDENDPPDEFSLIYPGSGENVTTLQPALKWNNAFDPDPLDTVTYTVYYGSSILNLQSVDVGVDTSYQIPNSLQDNTIYYWKVMAKDLSGATRENTGGYHQFTVNLFNDPPGDFALLSPLDSAMVTDLLPKFIWESSSDVDKGEVSRTPDKLKTKAITGYRLYIHEINDFTGVTPYETTATNYRLTDPLTEDTYYYWKVEALDDLGAVTSSSVYSFWTNSENSVPEPFALISPVHEGVLTEKVVSLQWESSDDADLYDAISYTVKLGTSPTEMTDIYEGPDTVFTTSELTDNTIYYWKVMAKDLSGATRENTGGYHQFTVNTENVKPTAPVIISPDSVIVVNLNVAFHWKESIDINPGDEVRYKMHWWGLDIPEDSISIDSNSVKVQLADNSQYFWKVFAYDNYNAFSESGTATFWTDAFPEPPFDFNTITPLADAHLQSESVDFIWSKTTDPDPLDEVYYRVVVAKDWNDSDTYIYSDLTTDTTLSMTLTMNDQYFWVVEAWDSDSLMTPSNSGQVYSFVLGSVSVLGAGIPTEFQLAQNYPNPFNPTTSIEYSLPEQADVKLMIFDIKGNTVKQWTYTNQSAGYYSVVWDGTNNNGNQVSTGIYFYRIIVGEFMQTKKMVFMK